MRRVLSIIFLIPVIAIAQAPIEKIIPVHADQKLVLDFEYPEIVNIQTWDEKEILIKGTVSINRGENDGAFELQIKQAEKEITITSTLRDKDKIPKRILIRRGDREFYFNTGDYNDPEVKKFLQEHGEKGYMSTGIIQEIKLEVFVPQNMETVIDAKFGLVEVKKFHGPLTINAEFGGVDVSLAAPTVGELTARTQFGEILTNLDTKFNSNLPAEQQRSNWTLVSAKPGTGPKYDLKSKFGKVYLRKEQ